MFVGIPLSKIILRHREQVAIGKYRISSKFKPQYSTTDQLDDLLKKHGALEPKTAEQSSEETAERESDEAEAIVGQVEHQAIDQILFELEKNLELSIEPRLDKLEPFQTDIWDASPEIPNVLMADLKWELAEAYLDMFALNNIVWFLREFYMESPTLADQYTKMCNQIAITLKKVIPILKTVKIREI